MCIRDRVKDPNTGEYVEGQRLQGVKQIWKNLDEISPHMQNAVIAIEDERFETHYGVDWKRTIAAFANLVLHFSSNEFGGSTITQQLIKVLTEEAVSYTHLSSVPGWKTMHIATPKPARNPNIRSRDRMK